MPETPNAAVTVTPVRIQRKNGSGSSAASGSKTNASSCSFLN